MSTEYFDWLIGRIGGPEKDGVTYEKLLWQLYKTPFTYILEMDKNRTDDGLALRTQYGYDIPDAPPKCSVLEMMIGVAIRCEDVMYDNGRFSAGFWFWRMIENLELGFMDDANYEPYYVEHVTNRLISRDYEPDGRGGLFYISEPPDDMRNVQIWYQMNWYLDLYI